MPPVTLTSILPVDVPKHPTFVWVWLRTNVAGSVIVAEAVNVHPLASVTRKLYVPAVRLNTPTPV